MSKSVGTKNRAVPLTWGEPGAPEDFGTDRRCVRGISCVVYGQLAAQNLKPEPVRISRFATPHRYFDAKGRHVEELLCERCSQKQIDDDLERAQSEYYEALHLYTGVKLPSLRAIRTQRGRTQRWLADEAGTDDSKISTMERGLGRASPEMAEALAGALGVSVDELREPRKPANLADLEKRARLARLAELTETGKGAA